MSFNISENIQIIIPITKPNANYALILVLQKMNKLNA